MGVLPPYIPMDANLYLGIEDRWPYKLYLEGRATSTLFETRAGWPGRAAWSARKPRSRRCPQQDHSFLPEREAERPDPQSMNSSFKPRQTRMFPTTRKCSSRTSIRRSKQRARRRRPKPPARTARCSIARSMFPRQAARRTIPSRCRARPRKISNLAIDLAGSLAFISSRWKRKRRH